MRATPGDGFARAEGEQIGIAGDDHVGLRGEGGRQDVIVVRVEHSAGFA